MYFQQIKKIIQLALLLLLAGISNLCFADTIETQVSSDKVAVGDTFFVTYILNNSTNRSSSPDFSALQKDFQILNTSYSTAVNMINGVTTTQTSWRLQLEPMKAGELTLPEITIGGDKSIPTNVTVSNTPVAQTASTTGATGSTDAKKSPPVLVKGEVSTTSPYVESQVLYTFKLYFRGQLRDPRVELPQNRDDTLFQLGETQDYQTTINGERYNVVEKTFAIFPKKAGTLTIDPMRFHALVLEDDGSGFFDPFNVAQPQLVSVATKQYNLTVRDIPANYQGGAWLPAKDISLTELWSDSSGQWEAGTPVTRTIRVEAQGMRSDQIPDLSIDKINGVSVYVDKPKRDNNIRNDMLVGVYEQKVTYIPNSAQSFTIPGLKLNWWNTEKSTNEVAKTSELAVQVKAAPGVANPPAIAPVSSPLPQPAAQPVAIQTATPTAKAFYGSVWFWVACVLLAAWLLTVWLMLRKKKDSSAPVVKPVPVSTEMSDKSFEQACHSGDAVSAQQFLLDWAKTRWPGTTLNLATLEELIHDEPFSSALRDLERALYAKKAVAWNGEALLAAFQRIKKMKKGQSTITQKDLLPPLNPVE